jgi:hypothetical protein
MLTNIRRVVFELQLFPYKWAHRDRNPRHPDGCINLLLFELGKKIWSWSIIGRRPDGMLRRPNGCKMEQKLHDTVEGLNKNPRRSDEWCLVCRASEQYGTSSGRMELWTDERPDGMTRRLDGWQGTEISDLYNSVESYETLLNSGIPVKKHLYIQVMLSNQNEANYKLTNSPFGHFGTKITWPVWKYIPGPRIKITLPFCHKGTKGKTE